MRLLFLIFIISSASIFIFSSNENVLETYELIDVETVQEQDILQVNAEIKAKSLVKISDSDKIIFKKLFVKEGDTLKKGDPIVEIEIDNEGERIDELSLETKLQNIQLEKQLILVRALENDFKESEVLFKAKAILKDEFDEAVFKYKNAKLSLKEMKLKHHQTIEKLDYITKRKITLITSPINGVVSKCPDIIFENYLHDKQEIEIFDSDNLNLVFYVDSSSFEKIDIGMTIKGTLSKKNGRDIVGIIEKKTPYPDQESIKKGILKYKVTARITDNKNNILIGDKVNSYITLDSLKTKYYVPFNVYINESDNSQNLELYNENGRLKLIKANFGEIKNGKIEVIDKDLDGYKVRTINSAKNDN